MGILYIADKMDECVFPVEILESIASHDVFVAHVIRATCRELSGLRTAPKPTKVYNLYRKYRRHDVVRIVYESPNKRGVDYLHFGDWTIHNYYNVRGDKYNLITVYNHTKCVNAAYRVKKRAHTYVSIDDNNVATPVLEMVPKMITKYGFDYVYHVHDTAGRYYRVKIMIRTSESSTTWYVC